MPPIAFLTGGVDFSDKKYILVHGNKEQNIAEIAIRYGTFINIVIQFLIVAFCIFLVIKLINSLRRKQDVKTVAPPVAGPTPTEQLLIEIRDELKIKRSL